MIATLLDFLATLLAVRGGGQVWTGPAPAAPSRCRRYHYATGVFGSKDGSLWARFDGAEAEIAEEVTRRSVLAIHGPE